MNISRDSWHYRFLNFLGFRPSKSLCLYFWQVVLFAPMVLLVRTVAIFFVSMAFLGVFFLLLTPIWLPIVEWDIFGNPSLTPEYFKHWLMPGMASLFWIACLVALIHHRVKQRRKHSPKPDGLIKSYLKAKKEKVCPTIKFD